MSENRYLKWLTSKTPSVYWHDSAVMSELEEAIGNGARGSTTNPFLVGATIQNNEPYWASMLGELAPTSDVDERAEELTRMVVTHMAKRLEVFRGEGAFKGYCCIQTNPNRPGDVRYIIDQATRYAAYANNLVIKIPATRAGIEAIEACAALGMNVAATVSFTVPQVLAVAEAFQRGIERARQNGLPTGIGIAVLMVGRLDDYLRDVMYDTCSSATEQDIIWAGTAAIKRAYGIFKEKGYACALMPAGCRGGYHITELAGAEMVMSIAPKIAAQLTQVEEKDFVQRIQQAVPADVIDRLLTMEEFRKAYEPDGMRIDEFITFGSLNRTLDQFSGCGWNVLQGM